MNFLIFIAVVAIILGVGYIYYIKDPAAAKKLLDKAEGKDA